MENVLEFTLDELHKRGKIGTRIYNALIVACKKKEKTYSEITLQDVIDFFDTHKDSLQGGLGESRNLGPAVIFPVLNMLIESGIDVKNRWIKLSKHIEKKTTRVLQDLKASPAASSASLREACKQAYQEGIALHIEREFAPELQKVKNELPTMTKEQVAQGQKIVLIFELDEKRDLEDNRTELKKGSLGDFISTNLKIEGWPLIDAPIPDKGKHYLAYAPNLL